MTTGQCEADADSGFCHLLSSVGAAQEGGDLEANPRALEAGHNTQDDASPLNRFLPVRHDV